jgi:hypothetical protein
MRGLSVTKTPRARFYFTLSSAEMFLQIEGERKARHQRYGKTIANL